jgi:hypothetical protein
MYEIPDWTEQLATKLPQLAQQVAGLINPQKQASDQLFQAIQKDPRLLGVFATIAKDNPQALGSLFGPNAAQYLGGLNETPEAALARSRNNASAAALSDPNISRDAALRDLTGQTSDQRRATAAQATSDELTVEHQKTIQDAINGLRESDPETYKKLSGIGALKSYFGTDPNEEAIKANEAAKAKAEGEARQRVDIIADRAKSPEGIKDLYKQFSNGTLSAADLGNAFEDPRTQGVKVYFDYQMKKEYDDFLLKKQAQMLKAQDDRAAQREKGLDERAAARLQADKDKQAEEDRTKAEKIIS